MNPRAWQRLDWVLLLAVVGLVLLGAAMIDSATVNSPGLQDYARRHLTFAVAGMAVLFLIAAFDYRLFTVFQWPLYVGALIMLLVVSVAGEARGGAQRWLDVGLLAIQPAEAAKAALLISLSQFLAARQKRIDRIWTLVQYGLLLFPPVMLIYLQPDLGTAISVVFLALGLMFAAGIAWRHVALVSAVTALSIPIIWMSLQDYMRQRVLVFFDPSMDAQATYNVRQALIAVGSGGLFGKGYRLGTQSQLHFLRVRHTDFIFPVIAEELGFVGSVLVIILFLVIIFRLLRIGLAARDAFGRLLAVGVALIIFFQAFVNINMNVGLLPVTGIPLPFISYGGSHLMTFLALVGLAQSVYAHRTPGV